MLDAASTPTFVPTLTPTRMRRETAVAAAAARRPDHGFVQPARATELAARPWRGGQLRLMREPWGHHTILHERAGEVRMVGEADAAMLAELLFVRMIRAERDRAGLVACAVGEA